ncbi:MAG: tRNA pseudouridine(38-40) synthase TruA [Clostridia bacterium]|nr:tRNA pseudouridine(38-40) synthase TruA [Clostridia bacterium]
MRIVLKIQYDGTAYCGWQVQPNGITVQETIEKAIENITGEKASLIASGRTDSGVHAKSQTAHFDTDHTLIPPDKFSYALNPILPEDIKILSSYLAPENFHARFSAKKKTYEYKMYKSEYPLPLKRRYAVNVSPLLDVEKMKEAAKVLVGKHDFKCFLAANSSVKDTVREIYSSSVREENGEIIYSVTGNGFLYNMVRIIAGTLVKAGEGKISAKDLEKIIENKDRTSAGITMPPEGLTLISVEYEKR